MKTKLIAGHRITLEEGIRYRASRPIAELSKSDYPVTITDLENDNEVLTVYKLNYAAANVLVNRFNNDRSSFSGRVWC